MSIWGGRLRFFSLRFQIFFSPLHVNGNITWVHCAGDKNQCSHIVHHCSSTVHALKNIKNGSHGIIHTFKIYFATVFSVFSFSNNKFNPNGPIFYFQWCEKPMVCWHGGFVSSKVCWVDDLLGLNLSLVVWISNSQHIIG